MKNNQKENRQLLVEIGPEAFTRSLLSNRNAITTGWKRVCKVYRDNSKRINTGGGPGEECELKLAQLFLFERGIQGEESTEPDEKIGRAKGMDAGLRTAEGMGRDRNQFRL